MQNKKQSILFLRHGNAPNDPSVYLSDYEKSLSTLGISQAKNVAPSIKKFTPEVIYCSPFLRTKMTAEHACAYINPQLILRDDLTERTFPQLYGKTKDDIRNEYSEEILNALQNRNENVEIPGGETVQAAAKRVVQGINSLLSSEHERILIISHGGPHAWLCCHLLGLPHNNLRSFRLDEAHISQFDFIRQQFDSVRFLNRTIL